MSGKLMRTAHSYFVSTLLWTNSSLYQNSFCFLVDQDILSVSTRHPEHISICIVVPEKIPVPTCWTCHIESRSLVLLAMT